MSDDQSWPDAPWNTTAWQDDHSNGTDYGYTPSAAWAITFVTLFALSALVHSFQAWRSKYWVMYPTLVLGATIEVMGWAARYWSNQNVLLVDPFLMQICTLIMAPVFFSAYDYILLGGAIAHLGPQYSVLRPAWYLYSFLAADCVSCILQAVGGGQASSTAADGQPTKTSTNIMVAGIIFQLCSMVIFVGLGVDFILRANARRPYAYRERQMAADAQKKLAKENEKLEHTNSDNTDVSEVIKRKEAEQVEERENLTRWWIMLAGAMISSIMIVTRGVYRSIELRQGWSGYLITHQIYQNVLDGIPMFIAVATFNFLHPWFILPKKTTWKGYH